MTTTSNIRVRFPYSTYVDENGIVYMTNQAQPAGTIPYELPVIESNQTEPSIADVDPEELSMDLTTGKLFVDKPTKKKRVRYFDHDSNWACNWTYDSNTDSIWLIPIG